MLKNSQSIEQTNEILKENDLPSYENKLEYSFRIAKKVIFEVNFGTLLSHQQQPYFATNASTFNHTRTDINNGGQCQERVLPIKSLAMKFFKKWDEKHCKQLSLSELEELKTDIEELKAVYPHIENTRFSEQVKLDRLHSKANSKK